MYLTRRCTGSGKSVTVGPLKRLPGISSAKFLWPGVRPYQTQNIYAPFAGSCTSPKKSKRIVRRPYRPSADHSWDAARRHLSWRWNMRTSTIPLRPPRIRRPFSVAEFVAGLTVRCRSSSSSVNIRRRMTDSPNQRYRTGQVRIPGKCSTMDMGNFKRDSPLDGRKRP